MQKTIVINKHEGVIDYGKQLQSSSHTSIIFTFFVF